MGGRDCGDEAMVSPMGRPVLRDSLVSDIMSCRKTIPTGIKDPRDMGSLKLDSGNYRRKIPLKSDRYNLRMTIRKSEDDPLNFSVILSYTDANGLIYIIRRYNGDHGEHKDQMTGRILSGPHIHTITEEYQLRGYKAEGFAVETDRYRTLMEAINVFLKDMNITYELPPGATTLDDYYD